MSPFTLSMLVLIYLVYSSWKDTKKMKDELEKERKELNANNGE